MSLRFLPYAAAGLVLFGCANTDPTPFVQAGVATLADVGAARANAGTAGEQQFASEQDAKIVGSGRLVADRNAQAYVDEIARNLDPHRRNPRFPITVRIIDDPTYNAFTPGGGFMYINSGLVAGLENEAQLAMVIAHETAHIDEGHIGKTRYGNAAAQGAARVASAALGQSGLTGPLSSVAEGATALGLQAAANTFSRAQETEADETGFGTLVRAGYDGREGARTFAILGAGKSETALTNALFSSHPMSTARQQILSQRAAGLPQGKIAEQAYVSRMSGIIASTIKALRAKGETDAAERIAARTGNLGTSATQ